MKIIDGKVISLAIKEEVKQEVEKVKGRGVNPSLAVILVGDNPASKVYVKNKKKACEFTGIKSVSYELPQDTTENELLDLVEELNKSKNIHGILVQLPLPKQIDENKIIMSIAPEKDVDCFHPMNVGYVYTGSKETFLPCTPAGVIELIKRSGYEISGKQCVVIGRSNIVGKPAAMLLMRENGTVTVCHSKTKNLPEICRAADIIVVATGKRNTLTPDMIQEGAVIIDVGMNRDENGKLCGDVDFDGCSQKAAAITPVPGGVGPMTIAMLMKNCLSAAKEQNNLNG
ncbi:MAG: bifunctional methylenetetrahydrofolate dehydrogenase/methenyltetrahydrofolate cyclohydrolase FolD [Clostridiales bacterium]|nr:bifunctional methylenetetrahydrofolate dehydrogenase/methenyltetrahydrofolate cyclohydrolase FolD [Clostridiales bacterium]